MHASHPDLPACLRVPAKAHHRGACPATVKEQPHAPDRSLTPTLSNAESRAPGKACGTAGELTGDPLYIHRQSCYLVGRERRVVDIPSDHPSCSKQHACLQFRHALYAPWARGKTMPVGVGHRPKARDNAASKHAWQGSLVCLAVLWSVHHGHQGVRVCILDTALLVTC